MRPLKLIHTLALLLTQLCFFAQNHYEFRLRTQNASCAEGWADLKISPPPPAGTYTINWSHGVSDNLLVTNLEQGNYNVQIRIAHPEDTLFVTRDTIFYFSIGSEFCAVGVDKYFSPNGDNYHDKLNLSNVQKYPNFELNIYNKWGQRVHHQEKNYEPWDGTWNGIDLPDGTYYYLFFYDAANTGQVAKGDITILR